MNAIFSKVKETYSHTGTLVSFIIKCRYLVSKLTSAPGSLTSPCTYWSKYCGIIRIHRGWIFVVFLDNPPPPCIYILDKTNFERVIYLIETEKQTHPRNDIQTNTPKKHPKNHINNCTVSSFHVFFFSFLHSVTCWIFFCFNYKKRKITGYLYNFRPALRLIPVYLTSDFMTLYFVRIKWDHSDANTINGMHTL